MSPVNHRVLQEHGYELHISATHPAARLPWHWIVTDTRNRVRQRDGRSSSDAYALHDARAALRELQAEIGEDQAA